MLEWRWMLPCYWCSDGSLETLEITTKRILQFKIVDEATTSVRLVTFSSQSAARTPGELGLLTRLVFTKYAANNAFSIMWFHWTWYAKEWWNYVKCMHQLFKWCNNGCLATGVGKLQSFFIDPGRNSEKHTGEPAALVEYFAKNNLISRRSLPGILVAEWLKHPTLEGRTLHSYPELWIFYLYLLPSSNYFTLNTTLLF